MKKLFFSFLSLMSLAGSAQAQSSTSLGLKAGGSYSSFTGKQATNYNSVFGFQVGAFANIGFTRLFAFQPEILYSQKGAKLSGADFTTRLGYVDVPLVFHVNTGGLFFEAGPQVGLLVSAKNKTSNTSVDVKDSYNAVDAGYVFGLGYQRKAGLGIGLRYNGGFINIEKPYLIGTAPVTSVQNNRRNSAFQLYLTYSVNGR